MLQPAQVNLYTTRDLRARGMGSLTENKQFNLKEEKTNLISKFLQKRLDKRRIFLWAKDEYLPMLHLFKQTRCRENEISNKSRPLDNKFGEKITCTLKSCTSARI